MSPTYAEWLAWCEAIRDTRFFKVQPHAPGATAGPVKITDRSEVQILARQGDQEAIDALERYRINMVKLRIS